MTNRRLPVCRGMTAYIGSPAKYVGLLAMTMICFFLISACQVDPGQQTTASRVIPPVATPSSASETKSTDAPAPSKAAETSGIRPTAASSPSWTSTASVEPAWVGVIEVSEGDMLTRDIMPQICQVFSLPEKTVKEALSSKWPSVLIRETLTDFRRMEGIIPPGRYEVKAGTNVDDLVRYWIDIAELRFNDLLLDEKAANSLAPYEQLALASVVEAECLANEQEEAVAAVFLNRLADGTKLQSCVTAEYALGYQRPFLTSEDLRVQSDYNTYQVHGLPAGPICVVGDTSLRAAFGRPSKDKLYYFFYDYILDELFLFSDYQAFKLEAAQSRERFIEQSTTVLRAKINKQKLYGKGPLN